MKTSLLPATIFCLLTTACSRTPEPLPDGSLADRIKASAEYITDVQEKSADSIEITFARKSYGAHWLGSYFQSAETVLKRLDEASHGARFREVRFIAKQISKKSPTPFLAMTLQYDMTGLRAKGLDNLATYDVGEVATDINFEEAGLRAVVEYCLDDSRMSPVLCGRLASGLY